MQIKFKGLCQRIRRNNGITEALFTSSPQSEFQEEHALVNVRADRGDISEGREYWITVEPAFPH